jgi:hypothetical protein
VAPAPPTGQATIRTVLIDTHKSQSMSARSLVLFLWRPPMIGAHLVPRAYR